MKVFLILFLYCSFNLLAQQGNDPCSAPESDQFDFWLGQWECSWKDAEGTVQKGSNNISKILGGCVIEENFNGNPGMQLIGKSHSVYSTPSGKWLQTWVDNNGGYLDFSGGMEGDKMILSRYVNLKDGTSFMQRMVWHNITENEFNWNWERSDDDGKSWTANWKLKYKRKKK